MCYLYSSESILKQSPRYAITIVEKLLKTGATFPLTSGFTDQYSYTWYLTPGTNVGTFTRFLSGWAAL